MSARKRKARRRALPPELSYRSPAGNLCRCRLEMKGERIGIVGTWRDRPSEEERSAALRFVTEELRQLGFEIGETTHDEGQGPGVGGAARSVEAVRRFLQTGDPGVATRPFLAK